jgi:hypothetical protein
MKKMICALFILSLTGCMFIVRDGEDVKSIGISKQRAQEELAVIDDEAKTFRAAQDSVGK